MNDAWLRMDDWLDDVARDLSRLLGDDASVTPTSKFFDALDELVAHDLIEVDYRADGIWFRMTPKGLATDARLSPRPTRRTRHRRAQR